MPLGVKTSRTQAYASWGKFLSSFSCNGPGRPCNVPSPQVHLAFFEGHPWLGPNPAFPHSPVPVLCGHASPFQALWGILRCKLKSSN
jgi:hypothetical protein